MPKPDGGPAFPLMVPTEFQFAHDGMSLRDWLAGQALAGILAFPGPVDGNRDKAKGLAAKAAYAYADAMIAERGRDA